MIPAAVNPDILRKTVIRMSLIPGKFTIRSPYLYTTCFILAIVGLLRVSERFFKKGCYDLSQETPDREEDTFGAKFLIMYSLSLKTCYFETW